MDNIDKLFDKVRTTIIRARLPNIETHTEQKGRKLRTDGHSEKIQNVHCDIDYQWRSAHPREDTSVRSRSESVRNRVTIRGNVCCPVVGQAFRRPRILFWVGQLSKVTIEQRREDYYLQDGQLCIACRFRNILHFWKRFVLNISISALVAKRDRNNIQETEAICFKFIFTFSIRVECQIQNKKKNDKKYSNNVLTYLPEWVKEFKENLMDRELSASAHCPQESDLEHHRNYDVCLRFKMTRDPCRRRTDEGLSRVEKFGDLITTDHRVLNEEDESRTNHRYVVVT